MADHPTIRIVAVPHRGTPTPVLHPARTCAGVVLPPSVALALAMATSPADFACRLSHVAHAGCPDAARALLTLWGEV